MALPYVKPGVTVSEIVSPNLTPVLLDPNLIAIVGPARGYREQVENVLLEDNTPYTLQATNADVSTIVVRDASNVLASPFVVTGASDEDFTVDDSNIATTGQVTVSRSMQTTISNGETVTVYFEQSGAPVQADGRTAQVTLNGLTAVTPTGANASSQAGFLVVPQGTLVVADDYTLTDEGGPAASITHVITSDRVGQFQTVYLDFEVGVNLFTDQPIQFNAGSAVDLPDNADGIIVKNAPGAPNTAPVAYEEGTLETLDYMEAGIAGTPTIRRSQGSTTIGGLNNRLVVRISYRATPFEYYQPTICYSQGDVEDKFGAAFDSAGNIANPLSAGTLFAFQNGASQVVAQALFNGAGAIPAAPTGTLSDWEDAFESLRNVQNLSAITPIISSGGLSVSPSDSLSIQIIAALQAHCRYMAAQENQFPIAICGEDGTIANLASTSTLQTHASTLADSTPSEATVLVSPSSFTFSNPVTGQTSDIGGQYVAAAVSGMMTRYPVQMPLTRKRINGLTSLKTLRTETQKDQDAQAGLMVVENKRGRIQVRHAITTNQNTRAQQEMSVVRAKYWMMTNLVELLDTQVIGQIILDANANFTIQVLISGELELLVQQGAIVSYGSIQVRPDPTNDTALQVRFSYLPAYPLNHIAITFSIDSSQGVSFDQTTTVQGF